MALNQFFYLLTYLPCLCLQNIFAFDRRRIVLALDTDGVLIFSTIMVIKRRVCAIHYHAPPQRVGVRAEIFLIDVSLDDVDEKRGENEAEKSDVERRKQLL